MAGRRAGELSAFEVELEGYNRARERSARRGRGQRRRRAARTLLPQRLLSSSRSASPTGRANLNVIPPRRVT
eukprot:524458-Rhodomonas_salina.1